MGLKKGMTNNPDGKPKGALSKKRVEWEEMGATLVGTWTAYVMKYGNDLVKDDKFDEFYPLYKDMVNYFRPKLASSQIKQETETKLTLSDEQILATIRDIANKLNEETPD